MKNVQQLISRYRDETKGIAILWVVFFHAQLGLNGFLYEIQKIGYGGVDLFFFLSGYGLYHSLSKGTKGYLARRARRILPAYLPFCLVWLAVMIPLSNLSFGQSVKTVLGNVFMVGYFFDAPLMINWYVSALAVSLLLAPALYACLKPGRLYWLRAAVLLAGMYLFGLLFVGNVKYMAVSRLPVFALGMIFAGPHNRRSEKWTPAALCVLGLIALGALLMCFRLRPEWLLRRGMYWHPFALIAPALCIGLGWGLKYVPARCLVPLRKLGGASFEIFLFNVWAELLGKKYGMGGSAANWILLTTASIALGLAYHHFLTSKRFVAFLKKRG